MNTNTSIRCIATLVLALTASGLAQSLAPAAPSDSEIKATILSIAARFEGRGEAIARAEMPREALPILEQMATDTELPGYQRIGAIELLAIVPGTEASTLLARIALTSTFDSAQRSVAARSLAQHDGAAALPTIVAMHDMGGDERRIAIEALAVCPDRGAFDHLERLVTELGSSGDPDALLALYRAREAWLAAARARGDFADETAGLQISRSATADGKIVTEQASLAADAVDAEKSLRLTLLSIGGASRSGSDANREQSLTLARGTAPISASFEVTRPQDGKGFAVLRTEHVQADGSFRLIAESVLLR